MQWLIKLQYVDRRWLYLVTFILLILPFATGFIMPPAKASETTLGLYNQIESCPSDKVVVIDASWEMGSAAENWSQLECVVRHLCMRHIKFVVVSVQITPFGPMFANLTIEPIAKETGMVYGKDWVNLGYTRGAAMGPIIEGICLNIAQVFPTDYEGTSVKEIPLMQALAKAEQTHKKIHLIYSVTYQSSTEWISFSRGSFGTPLAFGYMTIVHPSYYTFFDSGQLCGTLVGNGGAAEYEKLVNHEGLGTTLHSAGSFGNIMVIVAAILGNIGAWASHRQSRRRR